MARKEKNIHYIYKTTCNVTGRWYVGMHSTSNENDGYLGSGVVLRHSIRKYGVEKHTKKIIEHCNSREDLILREQEIVNKELISDGKCMNLKEGGTGGFISDEQQRHRSECGGKALALKLKTDIEFVKKHREIVSNNMKQGHINGKFTYNTFEGKSHSDKSKKLMSEQRKGTGLGENNSQYGSFWITDGVNNKKLKKDSPIPEGWGLGRK